MHKGCLLQQYCSYGPAKLAQEFTQPHFYTPPGKQIEGALRCSAVAAGAILDLKFFAGQGRFLSGQALLGLLETFVSASPPRRALPASPSAASKTSRAPSRPGAGPGTPAPAPRTSAAPRAPLAALGSWCPASASSHGTGGGKIGQQVRQRSVTETDSPSKAEALICMLCRSSVPADCYQPAASRFRAAVPRSPGAPCSKRPAGRAEEGAGTPT